MNHEGNDSQSEIEQHLLKAEKICTHMDLKNELEVIQRIKEGSKWELHLLSFF